MTAPVPAAEFLNRIPEHIRDAIDQALDELPQPLPLERARWRAASRAAYYAAAPLIAAAERDRIRQHIDPAKLRTLADWFDIDNRWGNSEVQDDLRAWAALLDDPVPAIPAEGTTP